MQRRVTAIVGHMSNSHLQMAKILETKRHIVAHTAGITHAVPDHETTFSGAADITENVLTICKSTAAYMSSLADFEEAMAETLTEVMKELDSPSEE